MKHSALLMASLFVTQVALGTERAPGDASPSPELNSANSEQLSPSIDDKSALQASSDLSLAIDVWPVVVLRCCLHLGRRNRFGLPKS